MVAREDRANLNYRHSCETRGSTNSEQMGSTEQCKIDKASAALWAVAEGDAQRPPTVKAPTHCLHRIPLGDELRPSSLPRNVFVTTCATTWPLPLI